MKKWCLEQSKKEKGRVLSSLPCYLSHEKRLEESFDGFAASPLLIFFSVVVVEKKNQRLYIYNTDCLSTTTTTTTCCCDVWEYWESCLVLFCLFWGFLSVREKREISLSASLLSLSLWMMMGRETCQKEHIVKWCFLCLVYKNKSEVLNFQEISLQLVSWCGFRVLKQPLSLFFCLELGL